MGEVYLKHTQRSDALIPVTIWNPAMHMWFWGFFLLSVLLLLSPFTFRTRIVHIVASKGNSLQPLYRSINPMECQEVPFLQTMYIIQYNITQFMCHAIFTTTKWSTSVYVRWAWIIRVISSEGGNCLPWCYHYWLVCYYDNQWCSDGDGASLDI